MKKEREKYGGSFPAVTGASSLLVIFSVLCLTVFALLSLSTVSAKHRIAENNSKALQGYYSAEEEANRVLAELRSGTTKLPDGVRKGSAEGCPSYTAESGNIYEYSCPISDSRTLAVRVWIGQEGGAEYRILRWQEVSSFDWENDEHIPVYQGE